MKTQTKNIISDCIILVTISTILGFICFGITKFLSVQDNPATEILTIMRKTEAKEKNAISSDELIKISELGMNDFSKKLKEITEEASKHGKIFANLTDNTGRTPAMWVCYGNYNNIDTALNTEQFRIAYLKLLTAQKGYEINQTDNDGWTALHWAAWSGFDTLCEELIQLGAQVNMPENNGYTPLMLAAMRGNSEVVEVLIKDGALLDFLCKDKKTALQLAIEGQNNYDKSFNFSKTEVQKTRATDFKHAIIEALPAEHQVKALDEIDKHINRKSHVNTSYELPRIFSALKKQGYTVSTEEEQKLTQSIKDKLNQSDIQKAKITTLPNNYTYTFPSNKDLKTSDTLDVRHAAYEKTVGQLKNAQLIIIEQTPVIQESVTQ